MMGGATQCSGVNLHYFVLFSCVYADALFCFRLKLIGWPATVDISSPRHAYSL